MIIGLLLIFVGYYMLYSSFNVPIEYLRGLIFGEGGILVLWGAREFFGGIINGSSRN